MYFKKYFCIYLSLDKSKPTQIQQNRLNWSIFKPFIWFKKAFFSPVMNIQDDLGQNTLDRDSNMRQGLYSNEKRIVPQLALHFYVHITVW